MERALDLAALADALGIHRELPTPDELQSLMADAEVGLFLQRTDLDERLLMSGWYLHGVASVTQAPATYGSERQRRAFQISAHIFELALTQSRPVAERLRLAFAAQVGYRRGGLDPNALAVYRAVESLVRADSDLMDHMETLALEAGVTLLALRPGLRRRLRSWVTQLDELARRLEVRDLRATIFGPPADVVRGAEALLRFLVQGDQDALEVARALLRRPIFDNAARSDLDSRWVANHLLDLSDDFEAGSVWRALPPNVPPEPREALAVVEPAVLTLWPPQRELIACHPSPLDPETKRVVVAVPTSAGKTLIAQLIVLAQLAAGGSVCYVVPTRSLGREVRRALAARLRLMRRELAREEPDLAFSSFLDLDLGDVPEPDVDVMTPERLLRRLRTDPDDVLLSYDLFVFDEAQLLGDPSRGFIMEAALAFLHWRTRGSGQRIVLLSAALGNRGQIRSWVDPDEAGLLFESDWRGPRRLHAVFSTSPDWGSERLEQRRSADWPVRAVYDVRGRLALRPAEGQVTHVGWNAPLGVLALRQNAYGRRPVSPRDSAHSTAHYRYVAKLAADVGHAGPVMIVCSQRDSAVRHARAIADLVPEVPEARLLADSVQARIGADHPLAATLRHGAAFHHAALPVDVLETIEAAVQEGLVRYLACTTTLTEGVNLPVRTVLLAETRYEGQDVGAQLVGSRLINAMGRAGRAGKESEGWVIQAVTGGNGANFAQFVPRDEELEVRSRLATAEALDDLAEFENAIRAGEDAVFAESSSHVADFVRFVWFVLANAENGMEDPSTLDLDDVLAATLGFAQLPAGDRGRWTAAAEDVRTTYLASPVDARRRWARLGTSLSAARTLDDLARDLALAARDTADTTEPGGALEALDSSGVLDALFALPEAPHPWGFRASPRGARDVVPDLTDVLGDWLGGTSIAALAARFLPEVGRELAIGQLVDAAAELFEHFLAWVLSGVIERTNELLEGAGHDDRVCPDLPLYVRYGVDSVVALQLMTSGVHSRALVHTVAAAAMDEGIDPAGMRDWLGQQSVEDWRSRFDATALDVLDLLEYTRSRERNALRDMLTDSTTSVPFAPLAGARITDEAVVLTAHDADASPARLAVRGDMSGELLGFVAANAQADVQAILDSGLGVRVDLAGDQVVLRLI